MKNTLAALVAVLVAVLVASHSMAFATDAVPAANGMNEAPANPNWQNLDASAGAENAKPAKKHGKARKHAKAKKGHKGHKARKHQRRH